MPERQAAVGPRTEVIPAAARSSACLTRSLGVVCEIPTSPRDAARRADGGTWRIPAAAFANGMSKAAREVKIDASLTQPLTARVATNGPTNSRCETVPNGMFCA
jgi:hypothetical protein